MPETMPADVLRVRADNPSPLTLDGTNTYLAGHWVVDPGPHDDAHLDAVVAAAAPDRIEGIVLTHDHPDHAEGADALSERTGARVRLPQGDEFVGPFEVIATPGHSPDHVALRFGRILFAGDTVLGEGSVFIAPGEGSLSGYLDSLRRLLELDLEAICPGHGPIVWNPREKLAEYLDHRLERERRLLDALASGARTRDELLSRAWSDIKFRSAPHLRVAAGLTLEAHLQKLAYEARLPIGVEGFSHRS